jgi:hypothetical protein
MLASALLLRTNAAAERHMSGIADIADDRTSS